MVACDAMGDEGAQYPELLARHDGPMRRMVNFPPRPSNMLLKVRLVFAEIMKQSGDGAGLPEPESAGCSPRRHGDGG